MMGDLMLKERPHLFGRQGPQESSREDDLGMKNSGQERDGETGLDPLNLQVCHFSHF
jgi:hypothetical protein